MGVGHGSPTQLSDDDPYVRWTQFTPDHSGVSVQQVAETIVDTAVASVTFSSITDVYRTLMIDVAARGDEVATSSALRVQFNGDTGASYDWVMAMDDGGFGAVDEEFGDTAMSLGFINASSATANEAGVGRFILPDYSRSQWNKSLMGQISRIEGTTANDHRIYTFSGRWRSSVIVTSITLFPDVGNFDVGSTFTLWGMV